VIEEREGDQESSFKEKNDARTHQEARKTVHISTDIVVTVLAVNGIGSALVSGPNAVPFLAGSFFVPWSIPQTALRSDTRNLACEYSTQPECDQHRATQFHRAAA